MKPTAASRITITGSGKRSRRPEGDRVTGRQGDVPITLSPCHPVTLSPPHPVALSPLRAWRIGLIEAAWQRVVARALIQEDS